ncbi:response regulator [Primorskyibacter flagellatus]|uniref:response regulator n=1 Tax=Primorskyibacter flagellatus TaxID=1387277 RepID=UPI003A8E3C19
MSRTADQALILVVEDERALRNDIVEELQEAGYRTLAACSGDEALDLLASASPDLLLCDITMPGLDGYGVLHEIRSMRPELFAVPFVFLTAMSEPSEMIRGKLLGADDYLVKPVDYDLMLATIAARVRQVDRIRNQHESEITALREALASLSSTGAEAALNLIALGAVLLDGTAKPVHCNHAAKRMVATTDTIELDQDGFFSTDPLSNRDLKRAIGDAVGLAKSGKENVVGINLQQSGETGVISVVVCSLPQSGKANKGSPHVALFISTPDQKRRIPEALLMEIFDLTPTEARVAGSLARGNRSSDVAKELGVTQTTLSFHLRNLFQKTGTNRQADLIALILAGPMMIRSE